MDLREALRTQGPSYALQEAARDEIARLDAEKVRLEAALMAVSRFPDQAESLARQALLGAG